MITEGAAAGSLYVFQNTKDERMAFAWSLFGLGLGSHRHSLGREMIEIECRCGAYLTRVVSAVALREAKDTKVLFRFELEQALRDYLEHATTECPK